MTANVHPRPDIEGVILSHPLNYLLNRPLSGMPAWPPGPHQTLLRALALSRVPLVAQLQAVQAVGATREELAWLVTVAAPFLLSRRDHADPCRRVKLLADWSTRNLAMDAAALVVLCTDGVVPPGTDPELMRSLGLMPEWLRVAVNGQADLVFREGMPVDFEALRQAIGDVAVNLEITSPTVALQIPRTARIQNRLRLSRVSGLNTLRVDRFQGKGGTLAVEACPGLTQIRGFHGLAVATVLRCPDLQELHLQTAPTRLLRVEDCPSLTRIVFPPRQPGEIPPDVVVRRCPALESLGMEVKKPFQVRNLHLEGCPRLIELPTRLQVRGRRWIDGCPGVGL